MLNLDIPAETSVTLVVPQATLTTTSTEPTKAPELATVQTLGVVAQAQVDATEKFSIDSAVEAIESLRAQASTNHERYDVGGRIAMTKLMAKVYRIWHDAQVSGEFKALMNNVRRLLKDLDVEVRKNSPESSQLVRYVFSGIKAFSDKQVHVYGRSLNVAYAATPRVKPDAFYDFVEKTPDGFNGLREIGSITGTGNSTTKQRTPAVALSIVKTEKTCETIAIDWPAEDTFRFYIAVRNADGTTADLKPTLLSTESKDAVLLKFLDDRKKRLSPTKKVISEADKIALTQLNLAVSTQKIALLELQQQAKEAKETGTPEQCEKLISAVKSAEVVLASMTGAVKAFSTQIKAD